MTNKTKLSSTKTLNPWAGMVPPSFEHYERYLPAARAIPAADVRVCHTDVSRARTNAARGAKAILDREPDAAALPGVSIDAIRELDNLGAALAYAAGDVARYAPRIGDKTAAMATARAMRAKLLARADALVFDRALPAEAVAAIHRSHGPMDTAGDCVALAALFYKHADAVSKVYALDIAEIRATGELGDWLLANLRRVNTKREPDPALAAATDVRDRMWTLFERSWDAQVFRPGWFLYGRRASGLVPRLGSIVRVRRATQPEHATPTPPTEEAAVRPDER